MSKEIKFRVWDIIKKVFIPKETYALVQVDFKAFAVMVKEWEEYLQGEYFYPEYQIISFFTGLKDKNGIDIYEGDILEIQGFKNNWKTKVRFENGGFCIDVEEQPYNITLLGFLEDEAIVKIIGNIHENPELLK